VVRDVTRLAQEIVSAKLKIAANCAARTMLRDIEPVVEISQKTGLPIEVCTFIGSSPIRQYAENWTEDMMLDHTREAVTFAVKEGLTVMYVTEDTVRARPETLRRLFLTAIECGAKRLCLCDTVGTPHPPGRRTWCASPSRWCSRAAPRSGSTGTGTVTAASRWRTPSRPSVRVRRACTAARSGSGSAWAIRRWTSCS
jgi:hypothetical protein